MCCKRGWEAAEEMGRRSRDAEVDRLARELAQAQTREMALKAALEDVLKRAKEVDHAG